MVWACISRKGVGVIRILDELLTKEVYIDIFENEVIASTKKFGYIDPVNSYKFYYKYYQDNNPKHNLIYVKPGYYTTVPKLFILMPKVLIFTLSKICGFI